MKVKSDLYRNTPPENVADYVEAELTDASHGRGWLESIERAQENTTKTVSVLIGLLADAGIITASDLGSLLSEPHIGLIFVEEDSHV